MVPSVCDAKIFGSTAPSTAAQDTEVFVIWGNFSAEARITLCAKTIEFAVVFVKTPFPKREFDK